MRTRAYFTCAAACALNVGLALAWPDGPVMPIHAGLAIFCAFLAIGVAVP